MNFKYLLENNLIGKKELLLKLYKHIGLKEIDVVYILKLLIIEENITTSESIKLLEITKKEFEVFVAKMIKNKIIKIKFNDKDKAAMKFDFSNLWELLSAELTKTLKTPEEDLSNTKEDNIDAKKIKEIIKSNWTK